MATNPVELEARLIRDRDDLCAVFQDGIKPPSGARIGPEIEKFGVFVDSGAPLPYAGSASILSLFDALEVFGWRRESEFEGGPAIALRRGDAAITLEPGGQVELSGAPHVDLHLVASEIDGHFDELSPVSHELGIRWLGVGFHPTAGRKDCTSVAKIRYPFMREHFASTGSMGIDMMARTATVQVNLDFAGEADALRKLRFGLRISPIVAAMFSNSPFVDGRLSDGVSHRGRVWLDVDAARSTSVRAIWNAVCFSDYVDWALDVPMFAVRRGDRGVSVGGATFRQFLAGEIRGLRASHADWHTHVNSLFPDVRLKRTIELRCADAQGAELTIALPALWVGLLYDEQALAAAERLCEEWSYDEVRDLRERVWRTGLRTEFRNRRVRYWAEQVVDIAMAGLWRRAIPGPQSTDESVHLRSLERLVSRGTTPAEVAVEAWTTLRRSASSLHEVVDLRPR